MVILTRRKDEAIIFSTPDYSARVAEVVVLDIRGDTVRLGIVTQPAKVQGQDHVNQRTIRIDTSDKAE